MISTLFLYEKTIYYAKLEISDLIPGLKKTPLIHSYDVHKEIKEYRTIRFTRV